MKDKLNIVFIPFVLALAGLMVGYTFLNWLLFVRFGILHPKEGVTEILLPFGLAGVLAWLYIAPKLKVLQLKASDFYVFWAWLSLTVPTVLAQKYMTTATGRLTTLISMEEIGSRKPTKYYYVMDSYHVNTGVKRYHASYKITGRNSERLNMYLYVIMPVYGTEADIFTRKPSAWLGIVYEDETNSHKSHEIIEERYNSFIGLSQSRTEHGDFSSFLCFERIDQSSKHYEGFLRAFGQNISDTSNIIILKGMNEPYEARNGYRLQRLMIALFIAIFVWLLITTIPRIDPKELKRIKAGEPDLMIRIERQEWLDLIVPHEGYFVTPIIILVNIAVFLLMSFTGSDFVSFQADYLLDWGACYAPMIGEGQWWRLFTGVFLHSGVMHLVANMVCLFYVGIDLERMMSHPRYLGIYLLSGFAGSIVSVLWHTTPVVGVGASGAILGLFGAFIVLLLCGVYPWAYAKSLLWGVAIFVGFNLLAGAIPGIDSIAHIGGLLCGILLGLMSLGSCRRKVQEKG